MMPVVFWDNTLWFCVQRDGTSRTHLGCPSRIAMPLRKRALPIGWACLSFLAFSQSRLFGIWQPILVAFILAVAQWCTWIYVQVYLYVSWFCMGQFPKIASNMAAKFRVPFICHWPVEIQHGQDVYAYEVQLFLPMYKTSPNLPSMAAN